MIRIPLLLRLLTLCLGLLTPLSASASLTALISIHEGGTDMWEQRETLQNLLRKRFGFNDVRFLVDATPDEVPLRIKKFLEEDADPEDRRMVWVSGFSSRQNDTVCATRSFPSIHPTAASLILAPRCYTDVIALPQGSRHYALTAPAIGRTAARVGRTRATHAPWIAVLTLPSSNEAVIQGTNALVFSHLEAASLGHLDPAALLHHIRAKFRWNGSDYTPTLDLFDRGLSREGLRPFGVMNTGLQPETLMGGTPAHMRASTFGLYTKPDAQDGLAMSVNDREPVRVLRRDRNGQMRFVAVGSEYFGWVRTDDLVE